MCVTRLKTKRKPRNINLNIWTERKCSYERSKKKRSNNINDIQITQNSPCVRDFCTKKCSCDARIHTNGWPNEPTKLTNTRDLSFQLHFGLIPYTYISFYIEFMPWLFFRLHLIVYDFSIMSSLCQLCIMLMSKHRNGGALAYTSNTKLLQFSFESFFRNFKEIIAFFFSIRFSSKFSFSMRWRVYIDIYLTFFSRNLIEIGN